MSKEKVVKTSAKSAPWARREWLKSSAMVGAGLIASRGLASVCSTSTPAQMEGPFYPRIAQSDTDWNLLEYNGTTLETSFIQTVYLSGTVQDIHCNPLADTFVEIWQADQNGIYKHAADPRFAERNQQFQFWGRSKADANGAFEFLTLKPAPYPISATAFRTPHIHVKLFARGMRSLTTQIYFAGEDLNESDMIYSRLTPTEQDLVTVDFKVNSQGVMVGSIDFFLDPQGGRSLTPEMD